MPATQKRRCGISYGRFSDPIKQAHGDSEDRQARAYRDFCQRHNLTPLTEIFMDRGRSGYKDEHRKKGRLGVLIAHAKDGCFDRGSVIVVEAWDRLGRLRPDRQTDLVRELLETGVDIGVCQLNDVFTLEDFGTHKWIVLSTFIMLAFQESKQKAERVAASWQSRRTAAREGRLMPPRKADGRVSRLFSNRLPAWLEPAGDGARPVPERVAAVKRIFELAGTGYGRARIIAALQAEEIPPFGTGGRWTKAYVNKILNDRRALGEYQPRKDDGTPDGAAIPSYYPRVITEREWLLSRAGQEARRGRDKLGRALVRPERKHVNLFRGLLTEAESGEGFFLQLKVDKGSPGPRHVLRGQAGHSGRGKEVTFPYLVFEAAVLSLLKEVDPAEVLPGKDESASRADVLRAKLANVRADLAALQQDLREGHSKRLSALLREREAEEEQLAGDLQEELARAARPAERAWKALPTLADLVATGGDEARLKLRPVLRRVAEGARVLIVRRGSYQLAAVQMNFYGGGQRNWLIVNQAAGYNRPGGWRAWSLADVAGAGNLDLRRKADVRALEKELAALDLDELA